MPGWPRHLLIGLFVLASLKAAADEPTPRFKVTTRKKDDTVVAHGDNRKVVFVVKSLTGIGAATIERVEKTWPEVVSLKLHLNGLERLVVASGTAKLSVAVSSPEGQLRVRLWKDDREGEPLDRHSPYWMDVRVLDAEGKPARQLPLRAGRFEMTLPGVFLEANPPALSIEWIDFYRG